jgi:hypothetical protein
MSRLRAVAADPAIQAIAVLSLLVAAGFVVIALAWRGAARTPYVPIEVPWLISGGVAGLAMIGMGLGALSIHLSRRQAAEQRAALDELIRTATELMEHRN